MSQNFWLSSRDCIKSWMNFHARKNSGVQASGLVSYCCLLKILQLQIFCPNWLSIQQLVPLFSISWKINLDKFTQKTEHLFGLYVCTEVTTKLLFGKANENVFSGIVQAVQNKKVRCGTWQVTLLNIVLAGFHSDTSTVCHEKWSWQFPWKPF